MRREMIAAIILAAGESKRLGHPKQLIRIGGEMLLHRTIRTAEEAGCTPVIMVLGAHHAEILSHISPHPAVTLINPTWHKGMASSIRLGIEAVPKTASGAVLLTCDQPAISSAHLQLLMATGNLTASEYAGRHGVPAYFPSSMFTELTKLRGDAGARELLRSAPAVSLPNGELDIDTASDLDNAKLLFG
jgi:molybdenum cofactor cytidylyltransferase